MSRKKHVAVSLLVLMLCACSKQKTETADEPDRAEDGRGESSQVLNIALSVHATFDNLENGTRIVAPVALDRRYQKITKTEHIIEPKQEGLSGVPERSEDKANLIFVSGPLSGKKAVYKANYEVEIRSMRPGVFDSISGQPYGEFNDPKLREALKGVDAAAEDPHAVVSEAFKATVSSKATDAFRLASSFAKKLSEGGVPNRLVQGLIFTSDAAKPHVWVEALLPQLGWAPFDPVMARDAEDGGTAYRGQHPPDRLRILFGREFTLKKKADRVKIALSSPFQEPRAIVLGEKGITQSVGGSVTYALTRKKQ